VPGVATITSVVNKNATVMCSSKPDVPGIAQSSRRTE
jgi:hypothetical protein